MKIILATGIYPPDLGGPATYVANLARELATRGHDVTVVTYARNNDERREGGDAWWTVVSVAKHGGPLLRWRRYRAALRRCGHDADVIEAFSSISAGVPLLFSGLRSAQRVLRLGGDFFWERATDAGGTMSLLDWTGQSSLHRNIMSRVLRSFDHIIFSTNFQKHIYDRYYERLPDASVIENAVPDGTPCLHARHTPLRLLFVGRLVKFKNIASLILALAEADGTTLTIIGDGPEARRLRMLVHDLRMEGRVAFRDPVHGSGKNAAFAEHDLLVLPSMTEISPNVALEARASGLPVLLTENTGLSEYLRDGMVIAPLLSPTEIVLALREANDSYEDIAADAATPPPKRSWGDVAEEHVHLFQSLR